MFKADSGNTIPIYPNSFFLGAMFYNHINDAIRQECENTGYACPQWIDKKVLDDLTYLDKQDGGKRADEYYGNCHTLEFILRIGVNGLPEKAIIRCRPNNPTNSCSFESPQVSDKFFNRFINQEDENEKM